MPMSDFLLYYAYGSNLHPRRLHARIPSSELVGAATLNGYRLAFHKRGGDGSAKCNALFSGNPEHRLPGALFKLLASEKPILDEIEGEGYEVETVAVDLAGTPQQAFVYLAETDYIDNGLRPFHWYKDLVHLGAQYHNFASHHIELIAAVESIADHDPDRHHRNEQILKLMR